MRPSAAIGCSRSACSTAASSTLRVGPIGSTAPDATTRPSSAPPNCSSAAALARVRERGGRLFVLGVGGGAGHATHAVNDFRKLCDLESYTPTDNVSELSARINDEGWETAYSAWLRGSRLRREDALLVFS